MDYRILFNSLNDRLATNNVDLRITCAGGFALMVNGIRSTMDIDAFYRDDSWLKQQIKEVGDQWNANPDDELWLNNSLKSLNAVPEEDGTEPFLKLSNLEVRVVTLEYLLGMKLFSEREKDIEDAAKIIEKLGLTEPVDQVLIPYKRFNIDASSVIYAFSLAYGKGFMQDYLANNWSKAEEWFR